MLKKIYVTLARLKFSQNFYGARASNNTAEPQIAITKYHCVSMSKAAENPSNW